VRTMLACARAGAVLAAAVAAASLPVQPASAGSGSPTHVKPAKRPDSLRVAATRAHHVRSLQARGYSPAAIALLVERDLLTVTDVDRVNALARNALKSSRAAGAAGKSPAELLVVGVVEINPATEEEVRLAKDGLPSTMILRPKRISSSGDVVYSTNDAHVDEVRGSTLAALRENYRLYVPRHTAGA
jgi:hypothetical protein